MDAFECRGWLFVTVHDGRSVVNIKIEHKEDHIPYCVISIPEDIRERIITHRKESLTKVWFIHISIRLLFRLSNNISDME